MRFLNILLILLLFCSSAHAVPSVRVAFVHDGSSETEKQMSELYRREITAVTAGSYAVSFYDYFGDRTPAGVSAVLNRLNDDKTTDIIIALGLMSGREAVQKPSAKPLFIPYYLRLTSPVPVKKNIILTPVNIDFETELDEMLRVRDFKNMLLLLDDSFRSQFSGEISQVRLITAKRGVRLDIAYNTDSNEDLSVKIPAGTEAVMLSPLPRLDGQALKRLSGALAERNIASYAPFDFDYTERGFLMSRDSGLDAEKRARLVAVNLTDVLKGQKPSSQAMLSDKKRDLIINMKTASEIGLAVPFSVLEDAVLINSDARWSKNLTITDAVKEAVSANLSVIAGELGIKADSGNVAEVRSQLFPQLKAELGYTMIDKKNDFVELGSYADKSTDGSLSARQLIFSEKVLAQLEIMKKNHTALTYQQKYVELETGRLAASAFLNLLTAQTIYSIRQDNLRLCVTNLDLAKGRVEAGASDMSDVYYWESNISSARQSMLNAYSDKEKALYALNRVLNRKLTDRYTPVAVTLNGLNMENGLNRLITVITDENKYDSMAEFLINTAVSASPELMRIESQIGAASRQLVSDRRSDYVPDVFIYGSLSHNFYESREPYSGIDMEDETHWQAGVGLSLPFFEGGASRARVTRSRYQLDRMNVFYRDARNALEQGILSDISSLRAGYKAIRLSAEAADTARRSFYLIRDNYAEGTKPMTDLLSAQNASISADLVSANAVYGFMQNVVLLQRDLGSVSLFLDGGEYSEFTNKLIEHIGKE
ncbi:MAG: TolC family protein [Deferribacterales bacterium]